MSTTLRMATGGLKLVSQKLFGNRIPFELNIHINDRCNLACTYCYSNFYKRGLADLPTEKINGFVDGFAKLGVSEVSLIGGEPLLHRGFPEIVDHVKSKNLFGSTVTNGFLVRHRIESLKKLDLVCVSIDGPELVNDLTRGAGSYKRAVEGLRLLQEHDVNRQIRATIQRHNFEHIQSLVDLAIEFGASLNFGLLFHQTSDDGDFKTVSKEAPKDDDNRKALMKIIEFKKRYPNLFFNSLRNFENALEWPTTYAQFELSPEELDELPEFRSVPCYGGRTFATVDTDGRLYACTNRIGYEDDAPNLLEMGVERAWRELKDHACRGACFYISSVEKNLLSDLNIGAMVNVLSVNRIR